MTGTVKAGWRRLVEKANRHYEDEGGDRNTKFVHSTTYHDFFEGYAESRVLNKNGRGMHIERIYTGQYYRQNVSDGGRIALRLLYVGLYLLAMAVFAFGMTREAPSNSALCVEIPCLFSALTGVVMIPVLISYVTQPREMTIWGYTSSSKRLKRLSLLAAALLVATAVSTAVYCLVRPQEGMAWEPACILCSAVSAAAMAAIGLIERTIVYTTAPSRQKAWEDRVIIG